MVLYVWGQVFCVCILKGGVSDSFDLDQRCFWFPLESWCRDGFCEQIETLGDIGSHGFLLCV